MNGLERQVLRVQESADLANDREFALAAACVLASGAELARFTASLAGAEMDWARFNRLLDYHLVGSLALARLRRIAPGLLPAPIAAELGRGHLRDAALHAVHLRETIAVVDVLAKRGIDAIVLKGVAVACLLYPEAPECRTASDIDVLVASEDFDQADSCLVASGYVRTAPADYPARAARAMFFHLENVVTYASPAHGQVIEVHRRLTANPFVFHADFAALFRQSVQVETAAGPVRGIGGPALREYLAWHAATAIDCRLKWFADVARAGERCESADVETPALSFANAVLGRVGAAYTAPSSAEPAGEEWTADAERVIAAMRTCSDTARTRSLARMPQEIAFSAFHARLSPDPRAKRYFALRLLTDPRDALVLRLGPRFAPLYALVGPALAAWRWLTRAGADDGRGRQ